MKLLPEPHERSALLDALARLIDKQGFESFVRAPILEPSPKFFPDRWEPTRRGVRRLSLRLLRYAGIDDVDATIELYDGGGGEGYHHGAAAWFAGIDDGACRFGVDTKQLDADEAVVGTMCHEVAHAYREYHGLAGPHGQLEEEDTDVTTIFLGFGILTTNNAYRFRTSGQLVGGLITSKWEASQTGYLSPQSMAFLLAAQAVARGLARREMNNIAANLETNQRAFFREAHRELSRDVEALRMTLGVPPQHVWPSKEELELPSLPALPAQDGDEDDDEDGEPEQRPWNEGKTVFRVREPRATRWVMWGMGNVVTFGALAGMGDSFRWGVFLGGCAAGLFAGAALGHLRPIDQCSEPKCEAAIPVRGGDACPKCGGSIAGVIRSPADRLEVEEALEDGRSLVDVVGEIDRRNKKSRVRARLVLAAIAGIAVLFAYSDKIPRPATIATARAFGWKGVTVRLTGEIVARDGEPTVLSREDEQLSSFTMSDPSGTLEVWHDTKTVQREVRKGRRVRLWGHFVSVTVQKENGENADDRIFVATSLDVDD